MVVCGYTAARLEGRALEHALVLKAARRACPPAAQRVIRMRDSEGRWSPITSKEDHRVPGIFARMYKRATELKSELRGRGWTVLGADSPVRLEGESKLKSVDLRLVNGDGGVALVEAKWTRKGHRSGLSSARSSYPWRPRMQMPRCRCAMPRVHLRDLARAPRRS